ncbi:spondin domain-containing protein [Fodinibius sp.]|uniref:spondin domain-containing protein n=1 Tax=Fodinibius sp. TaxID=1872440 RepID=UPI002ACEEC94|nr:spondin domain-containing protein [Fodinibius sp.]MDZ7660042.1 spondin domain-containing protein [Fodinibius sp.]
MPFALFMEGESASRGLEWIAEDGFPADMIGDQDLPPSEEEGLADNIADHKGLTVPLSPPVYAVHDQGFEPFMEGEDAPSGVSIVAEDGFPAGMLGDMDLPPEMGLVDMLEAEDAVSIVGTEVNANGNVPALEPAAEGQGESVEFEITASPGDRLVPFLDVCAVERSLFFL